MAPSEFYVTAAELFYSTNKVYSIFYFFPFVMLKMVFFNAKR